MDLYGELVQEFGTLCTHKQLTEGAIDSDIFLEAKTSSCPYVRKINLLLNDGKWKEGIHFLLIVLAQAPPKVLKEEGDKWFRVLTTCFAKVNVECSVKSAAANALAYLLIQAEKYSELYNGLAKVNPVFLELLSKASKEWRKSAFSCLYHYLRIFPGQGLPLRGKLETRLVGFLLAPIESESRYESDAALAGKVYAVLPSSASSGKMSTKAEIKGAQLTQLLSVSHYAMDMILNNVIEEEEYDFSRDHKLKIDLSVFQRKIDDPCQRILTSVCLLTNSFSFLETFFSHGNSHGVKGCIKLLVGVCIRILQVEVASVSKKAGQEFKLLSLVLPTLQLKALALIKSLLTSIGDSLVLYHGILVQTLSHCLNPSGKDPGPDNQKENLNLKIVSYEILTLLMQVSGGKYSISESVGKVILADITPQKYVLVLRTMKQKDAMSFNSKRKRKQLATQEKTAHTTTDPPRESPEKFIAALDFLATVYSHCYHNINLLIVKELNDGLLSVLTSKDAALFPTAVKRSLFRAVIKLLDFPHPACPIRYSTVQSALMLGSQDSDREVRYTCDAASNAISRIISNPRVAVFNKFVESTKQAAAQNGVQDDEDKDNCSDVEMNQEEIEEEQSVQDEEEAQVEPEVQVEPQVQVQELESKMQIEEPVVDQEEPNTIITLASDDEVMDEPITEASVEATEVPSDSDIEEIPVEREASPTTSTKRKKKGKDAIKKLKMEEPAPASPRRSSRKRKIEVTPEEPEPTAEVDEENISVELQAMLDDFVGDAPSDVESDDE